ncbi:hypothetical protein COV18_01265 [Candidatus Woesearchaeota archaeon CG10_big_fil_rev_8_21_14_0_10_37_12]|nr:MAG: hypothetical protein COV18_01265 [Candidatus Woesearchaeota archaeon CG10_big_fil_rev_8_21_14_0_10_37_12]
MVLSWFEKNKGHAPTVLRIFFGVAFLVAGLDKILGLSMARGMFEGLFGAGLGAPLLYLAIIIEVLGGLALLFNYKTPLVSLVLAVFILVALISTFKLGDAPNVIASLREILVMNTGGGNTAVNFAYLAGLLSLAFASSGKRR